MGMESEQPILPSTLSWTLVEPSAFAFFSKKALRNGISKALVIVRCRRLDYF